MGVMATLAGSAETAAPAARRTPSRQPVGWLRVATAETAGPVGQVPPAAAAATVVSLGARTRSVGTVATAVPAEWVPPAARGATAAVVDVAAGPVCWAARVATAATAARVVKEDPAPSVVRVVSAALAAQVLARVRRWHTAVMAA